MKILAITAFYPPFHHGGYELRCKDVLDGLHKKGHEICMITNQVASKISSEEKEPFSVFRVLSLKSSGDNVFRRIHSDKQDLKKIEEIIDNFQPDLLYTWHLQNLSDAILPFLASLGIPLVHDEGGSEMIYLSRLQKRGLYFYKNEQDSAIKCFVKQGIKKYANLVSGGRIVPDWDWPEQMWMYFNSHSALEHAREMEVPLGDEIVIHSGIDNSRFPFQARSKISSPVRIVIPARIKEQKGCKDGILLVDELRKRNIPAKLLIIGEVQSVDYYNELVKVTHALGLSGLVEFRPMVSQQELSAIYQQTDICFFTSYFKTGFSRVPLEAMASGCLVITYGNEGSKEPVINGESGFIVKEGNLQGVVVQIEKLINEPKIYLNLLKAARRNVELNFNNESYIDLINTHLENFLARKASSHIFFSNKS
jgi:glycosyltransferase involved in cell wall biosynthesis